MWWNCTQTSFDPASSFDSSSVLASEQSFLAYDEAVDKANIYTAAVSDSTTRYFSIVSFTQLLPALTEINATSD